MTSASEGGGRRITEKQTEGTKSFDLCQNKGRRGPFCRRHISINPKSLSDISDLCSFDCLSIMGTGEREEREIRNDEGGGGVIIGRRNNVLIDRPRSSKAFAF